MPRLFIAWIFFLALAPVARSQKMEVNPANVAAAIDKCVEFLKGQQLKTGRVGAWNGHNENGSGQTCLVTLALLSAGRDIKSPEVSKALSYIRATKPTKVYEASLKVMVLCLAEPTKDMSDIKEIVRWLVKIQSPNGGWGYNEAGDTDESNTQFAVLALWEASKLGVEIPEKCFRSCVKYWVDTHVADGGWRYRQNGSSIGSMTCAGIASMVILQDAIDGVDAKVTENKIECCGKGQNQGFNLDRPMKWLADNFAVTHNPQSQGNAHTMYYLYALERVGRLTGQRFIGERDWYREGADYLLQNQKQNGIGMILGGGGETDNVTSTAMGLLFLSKGKRQVVIGHLQYGPPQSTDWQLHRRAIQNLTGNIEKVWKRELAWQQVRLDKATVNDLLETPILFISGSQEFKLDDRQRKLLKAYAEQGGFIFAEACNGDGCKGDAFDVSFRREMELIFDKPLQKLPPTHPIWTAEVKVLPSALPDGFWLYGLDACCRTSVVYSPISLSCRWELRRPFGPAKKLSESVEADLDNAVKLGINVAAYATGRELKDKLDAVQVLTPTANRQALNRGALKIPKIMHAGGADDTPKAIVNLMEMFKRETQALIENTTPTMSLTGDEVERYPLLYIHGRNKFAFSDQEREGLRKHFENSGFVIGDAICASKDFADCVRSEFRQVLPNSNWKRLDAKDPFILLADQGGYDLQSVTLVDKQNKQIGPPEIEALEWNGRIVMLFSPNDMSCAMESKHSMQCRGYVRDDSFRIGINMILYSLMQ